MAKIVGMHYMALVKKELFYLTKKKLLTKESALTVRKYCLAGDEELNVLGWKIIVGLKTKNTVKKGYVFKETQIPAVMEHRSWLMLKDHSKTSSATAYWKKLNDKLKAL